MREFITNKKISVHAIAGTHVVLLGLNASVQAKKSLLGFTIERKGALGDFKPLVGGSRKFENYDLEDLPDSRSSPIQSMMWGDYSVFPGKTYIYRVTPIYGLPDKRCAGDYIEVTITTESLEDKKHAIFFNRGVAGSQAYTRQFNKHMKYFSTEIGFGGHRRTVYKPFIKPEDVPNQAAFKWLSRGLEEGMLSFIKQANDSSWSIRASVYEFTWEPAMQAFVDAVDQGVDVRIIHHAKNESDWILKYDKKAGVTNISTWTDDTLPDVVFKNRYAEKVQNPDDQAQAAISAVRQLGVRDPDRIEALKNMMIPRTNTAISHNKFIILLKDKEPQQVWTGSTNFTAGGIFGQSNVGHILRDPNVASEYMDYWNQLSNDPISAKMKEFNTHKQPDLQDKEPQRVTAIFSPRKTLAMLQWYADRMNSAKSTIFFTSAFTVADEIFKVISVDNNTEACQPFLRYLLLEGKGGLLKKKVPILQACKQNRLAWGEVLKQRKDINVKDNHIEMLTGLNDHVNFIHTKYMLIDPLSDDPLVVSGSANFSSSSTTKNDENMLVIRGNTRVADIFLGEFMRLFNHFHSRNERNKLSDEDFVKRSFLKPDDSWTNCYYSEGTQEWNERLLFAGPGRNL